MTLSRPAIADSRCLPASNTRTPSSRPPRVIPGTILEPLWLSPLPEPPQNVLRFLVLLLPTCRRSQHIFLGRLLVMSFQALPTSTHTRDLTFTWQQRNNLTHGGLVTRSAETNYKKPISAVIRVPYSQPPRGVFRSLHPEPEAVSTTAIPNSIAFTRLPFCDGWTPTYFTGIISCTRRSSLRYRPRRTQPFGNQLVGNGSG